MHAKLLQRSGAAQSPQEKSKLEWDRPRSRDQIAVKTKCGRYSCCRITVDGRTHYELWRLQPGGSSFARLDKGSGLDNFLQAQVMAQQDANK